MGVVCTACSCLCDDIVIKDGKIYHACRKGCMLLTGEREKTRVEGGEADVEKAVERARELLKKPLILGLDNVCCEAQKAALKLAEETGAAVVDHSLLSGGELIRFAKELGREIEFEKFRDEGYLSFYWGANPHNSLPRHLSRFTYYPRSGKRQRGYEEDRFLVVADVRRSETAKIAEKSKSGLFLKVEKDGELVDSLLKAAEGKAGKYVEAARVLKEIEKAEVNAIFGGSGLYWGLRDLTKLGELVEKLDISFVPLTSKANMRGFAELMMKKAGSLCYDFGEGREIGLEDLPAVFESCKSVLVVGADPMRTFPHSLVEKLAGKDVIIVNSLKSVTSRVIDVEVVIATELSSFSGGRMIRSDGVEVEIPSHPSSHTTLGDAEVLEMLR